MDVNEIIKVEQLPKIVEQLELISNEIDKEVEYALSLECNDDSKNEVKKERAKINKLKNDLEDRRKIVKKTVLEPYERFEDIYNELVKNKLNNADETLKLRIDEIETSQKREKEEELKEFANEWIEYYKLTEIIKFEDIGLNITLSASMKSLKDQIIAFCEKIFNELTCISSDENREELLYEYQHNGFDYSKAVFTLKQKNQEIERLKKLQEENEIKKQEEQKVIEKVEEIVEEISVPKEILENEEEVTVTFTITDSVSRIRELKQYLIERGYKYD